MALAVAERYIGMIGCVDAHFGEFETEERLAHVQFFKGERIWDFWMAVAFMVNAYKLPQTSCMAWVCKIVATEVRGGVWDPR